jgi:hypothetical protein
MNDVITSLGQRVAFNPFIEIVDVLVNTVYLLE